MVDHALIVRDQQHRCPRRPVGHVAQDLQDRLARLGVERGGRFVGKHQGRLINQCPRDGDSLFLAAGELRRKMVQPLPKTELAQDLDAPAVHLLNAVAPQCGGHSHVLDRGERAEQVVQLKDETDVLAELDLLPFRGAARSWPRTSRLPSCIRRRAPIRVSKVDLPEPEGPVMITTSPRLISRSLSKRTWVLVSPLPYA